MSRERMMHDLHRVKREYRDTPNLSLDDAQFRKYFQLNPEQAKTLTSQLVESGFLVKRDDKYRMPGC